MNWKSQGRLISPLVTAQYIYIYMDGRRINFTWSNIEQIDYEIDMKKKKEEKRNKKQSRGLVQRRKKTESRIFGIYFWQDRVFDSGNTASGTGDTGRPFLFQIHHPPLSWSDLNRAHRMDTCFLYSKLVPHGDTMNFTALGKLRKPSQPLSLSLPPSPIHVDLPPFRTNWSTCNWSRPINQYTGTYTTVN